MLVNLTGIGNLSGTTQDLITTANTAAFTIGSGNNFALNSTAGNFNGFVVALSGATTGKLQLTEAANSTPGTAYWKGGVDGNWNGFTGGNTNTSNWTDSTGNTNTFQKPGSTTDVYFSAPSPANTATTLGVDFSIKSLTFNNSASISGNTLTVGNSTTGITANTGATGTINSILAGSGVTKNGVGTIVLGGSNSFTGGLTINDGTVQLANSGALNSGTPQAVSFGNTTSTNPVLQLNGNSLTSDALSAAATNNTPVIENANATPATLTVSQSSNTTYSGILRDRNGGGGGALSLIKTGSGTLSLGGTNSYTGTTAVNNGTLLVNGNSSAANGAVSVAATLGGTGTVGGATTISSGGRITGADIGTTGTLTLSSSLSINNGGIGYFDIVDNGAHDLLSIGGGLTLNTGAIIRVSGGLTTATTYNLFTYTGADPTLPGVVTFQNLSGGTLGSNYGFTASGGVLALNITSASKAIPSINIALSTTSRLMQSTAIGVSGTVGNSGPAILNGTLSDSGGNLAVTGFSPSGSFSVSASGGTQAYTGSTNSGSTLGNRTLGVTVSDPAADPTSATASTSVSVLQNRVVSASTVSTFGSVHQGAAVSGTTSLTSAGADDSNTRVTVANASADANGISVTGGTNPTFNGSTSDTRTVSGNIGTLGVVNGAITLTTTGEAGISGIQSPVNVTVNYSASVYSGKAAWTSGSNGNWATGANWADTLGGSVAGSPGVDGSFSAGDTATFGNVTGSPASLTISLNGTSPTLNGITFNSTATAYTIASGSGGSITLQGAATPVDVSTSFSPTISAALAGSGLNKTGAGTLILSGGSSYTGATEISNGVIQITGGNDRLPTATALTLGSGTASGKLILGDAATARNQTLAGLTTSGTGTANSIVGAAAANSALTVSIASGSTTYAGTLGGSGTNENNLSLTKSGAGTLVLTGNNTYIGGTTLTNGSLNLGSANAIGTTGTITFSGGALQFSAANTTDYSSRFVTTGNSAYNIDTNGQNVTFATALAASGTSGLTKNGAGGLVLSTAPTYTGTTTINNGYLQIGNVSNLSSGLLLLNGNAGAYAVFQSQGTITRTLGNTAGNVNWNANGGFAAKGGTLVLSFSGGASQYWGAGNFMGTGTAEMVFGSNTADNLVELQNGFDVGALTGTVSANFNRGVDVEGAVATVVGGASNYGVTGNAALLSGAITANVAPSGSPTTTVGDLGNNGLVKTGSGTLILNGNNTYSGATNIAAGTVIAGRDALVGVAGAFGDGHSVTQSNLAAPITITGTQAIVLGFGNYNTGSDGTTATNASPTVLIGGAYTVAIPISISTTITTSGTYGIGGSTDNTATFSGSITAGQNFTVTQVATTGSNALNITGGIAGGASGATKVANFNNVGAVNVSTTAISDGAGGGKMAVTQSGAGTTTFSAANTYTGSTTVSAGTLLVSGSGTINTTSGISITGGTLDYQNNTTGLTRNVTLNGGTFKNNSTQNYTGSLTFTSGTVAGTNLAGVALTIGTGQTLSPGNSPGTLVAGAQTWATGGNYNWQIVNATAAAGTGFDTINLTTGSVLNITATSGNQFNINLWSLISTGPDVNGNATNFNNASNYSWTLISTDQAITGFSADKFAINVGANNGTSGFSNPLAGGTFAVALADSNTDLVLTYTAVPEPATWSLLAVSLTVVVTLRRRRRG